MNEEVNTYNTKADIEYFISEHGVEDALLNHQHEPRIVPRIRRGREE